MKRLFPLVLVAFIFGCNDAEDFKKRNFIALSPENGTMDLMSESGTLGKPGSTQVFFLSMIKEDSPFYEGERIKLEQGFVVAKLKREHGDWEMNKAYELLDSVQMVESADRMDTGRFSNWSAKEKENCRELLRRRTEITSRFFDNVKIYVEEEAIETGISNEAYLKYEPVDKYVAIYTTKDSSITINGKTYTP